MEVGSSEIVHGEIARLTEEGMFTEEEIGTTCCFATQDKVGERPDGERWEVYTVLADSDTFGGAAADRHPARVLPVTAPQRTQHEESPAARLSTLDRFLPVWIGAAMGLGLVLGRLVPGLGSAIGAVAVDGVPSDRHRLVGDDVSGVGEGPLRPARHRHPRPPDAAGLALSGVGRRTGTDVHAGLGFRPTCPHIAPASSSSDSHPASRW